MREAIGGLILAGLLAAALGSYLYASILAVIGPLAGAASCELV